MPSFPPVTVNRKLITKKYKLLRLAVYNEYIPRKGTICDFNINNVNG
jgi:hypothetical protein